MGIGPVKNGPATGRNRSHRDFSVLLGGTLPTRPSACTYVCAVSLYLPSLREVLVRTTHLIHIDEKHACRTCMAHNVCARDFGNRRFYNKLPTSFDADREPLRIIHTGSVPAHLLKLVYLVSLGLGDNKLSGEDFDFPSRTCMLFFRSFSACSLKLSHILNSNEYFMGAFTGPAPSVKELNDLRRALVSSGDKCKGMTQSGLECSFLCAALGGYWHPPQNQHFMTRLLRNHTLAVVRPIIRRQERGDRAFHFRSYFFYSGVHFHTFDTTAFVCVAFFATTVA